MNPPQQTRVTAVWFVYLWLVDCRLYCAVCKILEEGEMERGLAHNALNK